MTESLRPHPRQSLSWLVPSAIYLAVVLPFLLLGTPNPRATFDEQVGHLPAIRQFSSQLPRPDLRDYSSATTPGYHLLLAAVDRYVSSDIRVLRLTGLLFGVGLVLTFSVAIRQILRRANAEREEVRSTGLSALVLSLPLVCSLYVVSASACVSPDNLGWWGVLALLLVTLCGRVGPRTWIVGGLLLALLVFVRQSHLWAAALIVVAGWKGGETAGDGSSGRWNRLIAAGLAVLPAVAIVAGFAAVWHGLTPPTYQAGRQVHTGGNLAVPAMILAVAGVIGLFFCGPLVRSDFLRTWWKWILLGTVGGVIVGLIPHTSFNQAAGRWSGLWNVAARLPVVADRSPFIVLLAGFGGTVLTTFALGLSGRDRLLFATAWLAFGAAQSANHEAWQRYYEPFCLIVFGLFAARQVQAGPRPVRVPIAGPLVLAVLMLVVTLISLR